MKICFRKLIEYATINCHEWLVEYGDPNDGSGLKPAFDKSKETAEKFEEVIETIYEKFLDDVFDIHSRIKKQDFIDKVEDDYSWLFNPDSIRRKMNPLL